MRCWIWLMLALSAVVGAPAHADVFEDAQAAWAQSDEIRLGKTALWARGVVVEEGPMTLRLEDGYLFPLYSGHVGTSEASPPRVVGFSFSGTASLEVRFAERRDAETFANRRVLRAGIRRESQRQVVEDQVFQTTVERAVILSADPAVQSLLEGLSAVGGKQLEGRDLGGGAEEYLVVDLRQVRQARRQAQISLRQRRAQMRQAGLTTTEWLREDRIRVDWLGQSPEDCRLVADLFTTERYGVVADPAPTAGERRDDRWLTVLRDPTGDWSGRYHTQVLAYGYDRVSSAHPISLIDDEPVKKDAMESPAGAGVDVYPVVVQPITGTLLPRTDPQDPTSAPGPAHRARPLQVTAAIQADPGRRGVVARMVFDEILYLRAVGEPLRAVRIDLPRQAIDEHWALLEAEGLEGRDVIALHFDPDRDPQDLLVVFDRPVPEGEIIQIHLVWKDEWIVRAGEGGRATWPGRFLPEIAPNPTGTIWAYDATVTTPVKLIGWPMTPIVAGEILEEERTGDAHRLVTGSGRARRPMMVLGDYRSKTTTTDGPVPMIGVHSLPMDDYNLDLFDVQIDQTARFYERFLGPYMPAEIHLVQVVGESGFAWGTGAAGWAMVSGNYMPERLIDPAELRREVSEWVYRDDYPHPEGTVVARQLAQQVFGQLLVPASLEDAWIGRSLPEAYAWFYIQAAFGKNDARDRRFHVREIVQERHVGEPWWSLTSASFNQVYGDPIQDWYGAYIFGWSLRKRVGDEAFFQAMRALVDERNGHLVTTAQVQAALEITSGVDLTAFFDGWVYSGNLAPITLDYQVTQGRQGPASVTGCVVSNVPFGLQEVPIGIQVGNQVEVHWIRLEDGAGSFTLTDLPRDPQVLLDPDKAILTWDREVYEGTGSCP